ncbi:DUF2569 family protein [Aminobacter ciceronei]|jgi:glucan phosphoethanolaminetransferase (alkaline phosphatase superfamily)|uniref:DUF2569 family protein n=1 Tax=Aminobacter ciceronei TaxID=150723 RepID=UPI003F6F4786
MTIAQRPAAEDEPKGLGGWLILVMVGILAAPFYGLGHLDVLAAFMKEPLPGHLNKFLGFELIAYVVTSLAFPIGLLVVMFMKKRYFPRLYVAWALVNIAVVIVHMFVAAVFFGNLFQTRATSLLDVLLSGLWRAVGLYGVGIIYMRRSLRVRNTFIN